MITVNKWRVDVIDRVNNQNRRIYYNVTSVRTEQVYELEQWVYKISIGHVNNSQTVIYDYYYPDDVKIILTTYKEGDQC